MENCMIDPPALDWERFDADEDPYADFSEDEISLFATDPGFGPEPEGLAL
jgi:hypothetical protein